MLLRFLAWGFSQRFTILVERGHKFKSEIAFKESCEVRQRRHLESLFPSLLLHRLPDLLHCDNHILV
ncbi:hypothetical protein D4R75_15140 [bacterium]|nr:MAG: hypothetical protein D4R75_15140 [bacterium]